MTSNFTHLLQMMMKLDFLQVICIIGDTLYKKLLIKSLKIVYFDRFSAVISLNTKNLTVDFRRN